MKNAELSLIPLALLGRATRLGWSPQEALFLRHGHWSTLQLFQAYTLRYYWCYLRFFSAQSVLIIAVNYLTRAGAMAGTGHYLLAEPYQRWCSVSHLAICSSACLFIMTTPYALFTQAVSGPCSTHLRYCAVQ